jgi:hypothetical protein
LDAAVTRQSKVAQRFGSLLAIYSAAFAAWESSATNATM